MTEKAILYDATACIGCRACQLACKQWNENSVDKMDKCGDYPNQADITANTWLKIMFNETDSYGEEKLFFSRRACMHCSDAACVEVCPTGALSRHELGFVTYNKDICSGCGYCVEFCPFEVPRSTRNTITGIAKMDKCTLCTSPGFDRIAESHEPACVQSCPTDALIFGERSDLISTGKQKVSTLKEQGCSNAYVYGENEMGGLHVLYVLEDSPDKYHLPSEPKFPVTATLWKDILQPAGLALGGLVMAGLGLNYIVAKRAQRIREKAGEVK